MAHFEEVRRPDISQIEADVLAWWEAQRIFEQSIEARADGPSYTFYEGPPTANGRPGIHHVMARTIKDVFCRFHTMKGCRVERKAGWDTHGLPVEIEVEKALGLNSKEDVLDYGMARFNRACRESVLTYKAEWDELTRQMGYWVDLSDPYVTFETAYIESVWWLIKQIHSRGLLYKGHKIQWYSPGSGTVLSSHEVSLGYREVQDPSVTVAFRSIQDPNLYFLAWTTTPWTLISNAALAVSPDIEYVYVRCASQSERTYVVARACLDVLKDDYKILKTVRGRDLTGIRYEPLFDWFARDGNNAWKIVPADFVSTGDGTGMVHIAPAFGADDYAVGQAEGLPVINPVRPNGHFEEDVPLVGGAWFKEADRKIIRDLRDRSLLHRHDSYVHNYPYDWRKDTPLMSYPVESWFIRTTALRDQLVALNQTINWQPNAIGTGRFGQWLENNVDWALSRRRFWGTPLPVWVSDKDPNYIEVIGSIEELRARCPDQLPEADEEVDLHRPFVDELTWPAPDGGVMRRVPETIDVWFDSGAMPFAQWHYPFENKEVFERNYPADFIAEGVDQTRGWFYTLHAIAVLVTGEAAFKNCVVNGLVLDEKGEKMSKTKGNAVDPFKMMTTYGADRVRWYLMSNSPPWEDLKFSERGIQEVDRKLFSTLTNVYSFFATYANIDGFNGQQKAVPLNRRPELDRWIISRMQTVSGEVDTAYADYHPTRAARAIEKFVDELSNWYIRRSRRRFWSAKSGVAAESDDKWAAYQTVWSCLSAVARLMAPLAPFCSEWLYQRLKPAQTGNDPVSVHLADFPVSDQSQIDTALERRMGLAQQIASSALALRNRAAINIRQPVARLIVVTGSSCDPNDVQAVADIILDEVNAKAIEYIDSSNEIVRRSARPNFRQLGRRAGPLMPKLKQTIMSLQPEALTAYAATGQMTLDLDGTAFELQPGDMEVVVEGVEGWLVTEEQGVTVAMDTTISHELLLEGLARESINRLQNLRKKAGYEVTDRIHVTWTASSEMAQALNQHEARVRNETLAISFDEEPKPAGSFTDSYEIAGEVLTFAISRSRKGSD